MPAQINNHAHLQQLNRNLSLHYAGAARQMGQLSSGLRVSRSSDDPASLALADGIHSEIRAVAEGARNIEQTFSLLQVAEGTLGEITNMVGRMHSLAMEAASSVYSDRDRVNINAEFLQLREEIDRTAGAATYNGRHLLTGANPHLEAASTALAGAATTGVNDIRISDAVAGTYTFADSRGDGRLTLGNGVLTQTMDLGDQLEQGAIPAGEHRVVIFDELGIRVTLNGPGVVGAPGRYADGALDGQTIVVSASTGFTFQVGPTEASNDVSRIRIPDMRASGPELAMESLSLRTMEDAQQALARLRQIQDQVTVERDHIGAFQNRLELSINTSMSVLERMQSAEADFREVDVARSVADLTRSQILAEAATSMSLSANTDTERILNLLR
ncbi:MAG: flagellin [Gemmatimonadota bacterium]